MSRVASGELAALMRELAERVLRPAAPARAHAPRPLEDRACRDCLHETADHCPCGCGCRHVANDEQRGESCACAGFR